MSECLEILLFSLLPLLYVVTTFSIHSISLSLLLRLFSNKFKCALTSLKFKSMACPQISGCDLCYLFFFFKQKFFAEFSPGLSPIYFNLFFPLLAQILTILRSFARSASYSSPISSINIRRH